MRQFNMKFKDIENDPVFLITNIPNRKESEILYGKLKHYFEKNKIDNEKQSNTSKEIELFNNIFISLHENCIKDNYMWEYCPLSVYKMNYEVLKNTYLKNYTDAKEIDFISDELNKLKTNEYFFRGIALNKVLYSEAIKKIEFSQKRKIEFLEKLIGNNENTETPPTIAESKQTTMEQEHDTYEIDFETIADKILSLYELGVIDKLREHHSFLSSIHKLAEYLAPITGIGKKSIYPVLNALLQENRNNKNYPKKDKRLKKIHDKLINFGIDREKLKSTTPTDTTD